MNDGQDLFALGAHERQARRADPLASEAGLLNRQFNVLHELGMRIQV